MPYDYKGAGKGSMPRPYSVDFNTYDDNWERIFGKKEKEMTAKIVETENGPVCGCGRSPTGHCMGWHSLSEEDFQSELNKYLEETLSRSEEQ